MKTNEYQFRTTLNIHSLIRNGSENGCFFDSKYSLSEVRHKFGRHGAYVILPHESGEQ